MSRTPAAEFARLKVVLPEWSIRRVQPGKGAGLTARRMLAEGRRQLRALALADLEYQLRHACRIGARRG